MFDIVKLFSNDSNQWLNYLLLTLAMGRIYLEVIEFQFEKLPLSQKIFLNNKEQLKKFHKNGLYLAIGYIVFSAPSVLISSGV
jgi:hypothetical protein